MVKKTMPSSPGERSSKRSNNYSHAERGREAAMAERGARKKAKGAVATSEKNTVQSLAKGFRVLEAFTSQEPELTMAEVARLAGMDNATAFRFLNTLVDIGY